MLEVGEKQADLSNGRIALRRVTRRIIPFVFLMCITAWLDRVNVGFAALARLFVQSNLRGVHRIPFGLVSLPNDTLVDVCRLLAADNSSGTLLAHSWLLGVTRSRQDPQRAIPLTVGYST